MMKEKKDPIAMAREVQRNEFLEYLQGKSASNSTFLKAMYQKVKKGELLTGKMVVAIRNCMIQDQERLKKYESVVKAIKSINEEVTPKMSGPKITLKMRQWWMNANNLDSRVITGTILKETAKAYFLEGYADMVEGTWCMRCGRELSEPASMLIGYGEECCERLGIPYPKHIKTDSKEERLAIREKLIHVLHDQKFNIICP